MNKTDGFYRAYLTHRHISRRGLFRALLTASRKSARTEEDGLPLLPRPPGALPPALFRRQCDRCQQCIEHCPMGVIIKDDDGYPQLSIEYASCDGCNQCIQHCAAGALLPQTRFDTGLRPAINPAGCINRRRRCGQCIAGCPTRALTADAAGVPAVDSQTCNGCGECLTRCDERAITLVMPATARQD
ncbi:MULTISPECIES: 4Fe-4S dicluster domain-containing protein [unclassified Brenneria]|uniref:4Fe-4S dicluster domain-containing protein n=1 Tax=unclassified Brenneria TaxID=2634434 RepID=UPI001553890A|nr:MULTISPECIES: 4Fe-4S dicluster domain-containing protein [unclassified Brenneria]MBJ7221310.1 4Fe-4S dicluster domain-containing protein [Brenneria sp. L3-3C-1]MEE3642554.1 4Fe-4S dicluster domain-containing protein [Brenneria sp. L3_3C_1]MEE3650074.1 4Fe-4S dicluster domain-containing protein [Brenneria sp. HEZEL_4_2_4]NPD00033.1 4Fe-4S dicluster domain-containing protein [Brenneria sp. hezel4-2-4]